MKNILALIGLVVVLTAGLGWYLGWYKLGTEPGDSGHRVINVDVNTQKITDDLKKGGQKVGEIITPDKGSTPAAERKDGQPSGLHVREDGTTVITFPKLEIKGGN